MHFRRPGGVYLMSLHGAAAKGTALKRAILLLILIAICRPALALGKVIVDPNASAAAVQANTEIDDTDPRLAQKVTLTESRKLVSAILDDLTKTTGVVFKAGYNNNDWQVRDRKMCIFAKDVPLVQLMNSISHVMKFKWERKGEIGKWQYRLYMNRRTLLDADAQKLREDERLRAKAAAKRKAALDDYMNVDSLSSADLARLKDNDPLMYVFATTGIAGSMGQMFREVPPLSEAMAAGQPITMTGADMSEQGRAGLGRLMTSILNFAKTLKPGDHSIPDSPDPAAVTVEFNRDLERSTGGMPQYIVLATMSISFGQSGRANLPLMNPDSAIGHVLGNALIKCMDGQLNINDLEKQMQGDVQKAALSDMEAVKTDYGEPEIQHADDPALKSKVKLEPDGTRLADVQRALADASGFAVVSDSFGKMDDPGGFYSFVKDENELGAVLDKLTKRLFYNWDKKALVLEFRDREWFRKRSAQIPEATLEGWRQTFKKTGTLDLPDLAEIARLDQEQYNMNVSQDEVLSVPELNSVITMNRDMLRIYASLNDSQRAAVLSDIGLDLRDLFPEQHAAAESVIRTRNARYTQKPDELTLKIWSTPSGKQFRYDCQVVTTEDLPPVKWEFTTPKYQERKQSDKPAEPAKPSNTAKPADPAGPAQPAK